MKPITATRKSDFTHEYHLKKAIEEGKAAANAITPTFGFGYVCIVFDGRSSFLKFLKKHHPEFNISAHYPSGQSFAIWDYEQSHCLKITYARTFCAYLNRAGIKCYFEAHSSGIGKIYY